jgi:hypothetical protein
MGTLESSSIYGIQIRESATDGSDFSNAAADYRIAFIGEDGLWHVKDSAGTVTDPFTGSGSVATDAIWDAAGDLAVGTGANTAARLAIGNAGGTLARINGAVAWNASTTFPTATTGDRFFRTDLGMEFYYDGTRWLSMQLFSVQAIPSLAGANPGQSGDITSELAATATPGGGFIPLGPSLGGSDHYLVDFTTNFYVGTGTALSGSHKWVGVLQGINSAAASSGTVTIATIDSGASTTYRTVSTAINAVKGAGTVYWRMDWTKTGTPGNLRVMEVLTYRIVAT